ncbi:hypothetical protein PMI42_00516 [Bradyrhizobium sp. YR681]|uniref:hypothetical protein n=1 Tax=Bradyrhizobium sp. YR681 TaxID=1144344 RepID=UPI0002713906|nr:hypothetical protein [Bradyrhizobium sp. YR681]EJN15939.1 hypothetical protein PMI42_00516 [Bradyrhizobium sp. YR681]
MHDVIKQSIDAHGGLERWGELRQISATFTAGGPAFEQRGQEAFTRMPTRVTIDTRTQRTVFEPFLMAGRRGIFEPHRTAVESSDGAPLEELNDPRNSFEGRPWSATQLAYFAGYAIWMYLTVPFSLLRHGIRCEEVRPWLEDGETWRSLKVSFPKSYVTHSTEQTLYFDAAGMIRRQDYSVEVSGGAKVAHYLYDHREFDGIVFPTRRRVFLRAPDLTPQKDLAVITADFRDINLISA